MASADGPDGALDEMLDDALRDLEADAAPQPPPAPEDGGPSAAKTSRQSAGTSTSGEPSGLTFDPMKRPRPKRAAPRGAGGARGEKLEDAREVYAGLMSLVQGMDTREGGQAQGPWPQGVEHQETLNALQAALAQSVHPGQASPEESDAEENSALKTIVGAVMQKLLSKDMLYEPMKDICLRYPAWFEAHEAGLDPAEMERFRKQYEYMQQIIELYERDPDNTIELMSLMQQVQQYGQPPQEIVDQVAPSEDLTGMFQGCAPGFVPPADLPEMPEDCKMQ